MNIHKLNPFHKCKSFLGDGFGFYRCKVCNRQYYEVVISKADEYYNTKLVKL